MFVGGLYVAGAVEGPATLEDDAAADGATVFAGVGATLEIFATPEPEDAEELVVTVVNGVMSPGE